MPRILIADDSSASRRALRNLIEGNGWEVCGEAQDGLAAVERTAVLKPDLVILDFRMPNLNGLQAGQMIHTAHPGIPLLLFTLDRIDGPLEGLAREAGFWGALAKSEGIFALSQAIEELVQGKTFFLTASGTLPLNPHRDPKSVDGETKKRLNATGEPATRDAASRR
jgi:DNA-binding NarL/FixJ family response regulator